MDNILCILFGHKLGEWEYIAENSCQQIRKCKRDSFQERRSRPHQFGEWEYTADKSCQQVRICKRDNFKETRGLHQFNEWKYVTDSSCEQIRSCTRDGAEERRVEHDWGYFDTGEVDEEASDAATYERGGYITSADPSVTIYRTERRCKRCGHG